MTQFRLPLLLCTLFLFSLSAHASDPRQPIWQFYRQYNDFFNQRKPKDILKCFAPDFVARKKPVMVYKPGENAAKSLATLTYRSESTKSKVEVKTVVVKGNVATVTKVQTIDFEVDNPRVKGQMLSLRYVVTTVDEVKKFGSKWLISKMSIEKEEKFNGNKRLRGSQ